MRPAHFMWIVCDIRQDGDLLVPNCDIQRPSSLFVGNQALSIEFAECRDIYAWARRNGLLHSHDEPESVLDWQRKITEMKFAVDRFYSGEESAKLLDACNQNLLDVRTEFRRDNKQLELVPKDLHTALWLELALAIHHKKKFRRCTWCGRPFEAKGKQKTATRVFCSNACKHMDFRARKEYEK